MPSRGSLRRRTPSPAQRQAAQANAQDWLIRMADESDVREIAGSLEGVEEIDSDGFDFRVTGKGFVWSYPQREAGKPRMIRTDIAVLYVGDEAEKQALVKGEPDKFFT